MATGGCATSADNSNADSKGPDELAKSFKECYDSCKNRENCYFFGYKAYQESGDVNCQMHSWTDLDRGNGNVAYKCYKYEKNGKLTFLNFTIHLPLMDRPSVKCV